MAETYADKKAGRYEYSVIRWHYLGHGDFEKASVLKFTDREEAEKFLKKRQENNPDRANIFYRMKARKVK